MKQITDILKSKQFLIGVGVGVAGVYLYNRYMAKEQTSNAGGDKEYKCCCDGGISGISDVPCGELTHYSNCRPCRTIYTR